MALDSNGNPDFTYLSDGKLIYASWTGSNWINQTVASILYPSPAYLALDSQNHPHIVYYNEASDSFIGALMYASWGGNSWNIQTIDPNNATAPGSIALDSNGNPYIVYSAQPPNAGQPSDIGYYLNYATITQPTQTPTRTSSTIFSTSTLLTVSIAVILGAIATVVYVWKKKIQKKS